MRCEACHGTGFVELMSEPCEVCGGCGVDYCCGGHLASPDCWCEPVEESPGVWVHQDPTVH